MDNYICDCCGRQFPQVELVIVANDTETVNVFCKECSKYFGTCYFCEQSAQCAFEQDPDPTPKFVMIQQHQQTPMGCSIIQRQVPNTERLRKFCLDGKCPCCNEDDPKDPFCCRHTGYATCGNFKEHIFPSQNK